MNRRQETDLIETVQHWLTTEERTDLNGVRLLQVLLDAFVDAVNERCDHQVRADEAEAERARAVKALDEIENAAFHVTVTHYEVERIRSLHGVARVVSEESNE
jgi:hypothetical protein